MIRFISSTRSEFSIWLPLMLELKKQRILFDIICCGRKHFVSIKKYFSSINMEVNIHYILFNEKPKNSHERNRNITRIFANIINRKIIHDNDCVFILGDRYELIPFANYCFLNNVKIIHFCGGDETKGSQDDKIRHQISILSNIHFVTNENSQKKLFNFGIDKDKIINTGHLGLIGYKHLIVNRDLFSKGCRFNFNKYNILVTLHPDTTQSLSYNKKLTKNLIKALCDQSKKNTNILFTGSNGDLYSKDMETLVKSTINKKNNFYFCQSLGPELFTTALNEFEIFIGNSSSIFYEAPNYNIMSINIGDRQKGRIKNPSILNTNIETEEIKEKIKIALSKFPMPTLNPYHKINTIELILRKLKTEKLICQ